MTPRQLIRLAMGLGALLLLWGGVALTRRTGHDAETTWSLPRVAPAEVDTIVITHQRDSILLARQTADRWRVNGHPAEGTAVKELLSALGDSNVTGELVAQSAATHARLGVDSAGGRRVRFLGKGRTLADLVVGEQGQVYGTSYLRRPGDAAVYQVHSALHQFTARNSDDWRDKRIASVAADSASTIEVRRGERTYAMRREGKKWAFASGAPADSTAAIALAGSLQDIMASGFATAGQADSANFAKPRRHLRVLGPGGTPLIALGFDSTAGGFWVKSDSGGPVYRIDSWEADRLTPSDSTLKPKKAVR